MLCVALLIGVVYTTCRRYVSRTYVWHKVNQWRQCRTFVLPVGNPCQLYHAAPSLCRDVERWGKQGHAIGQELPF